MFWGLVLEPEKSYSQTVEIPFHVSMAALDVKQSDPEEEASTLIFRQNQDEFILGNLSRKNKIFNVPLALDFDMGEEIEFTVQGSSQIHLTGFIADSDDLNEGGEEEEDEEDEEEEEATAELKEKAKEIQKAKSAKRKLTDGDKKGAPKKQRILDESFNEDTDEDDFDVTAKDFDSDDDEESEDDDDDDDEDEDDDDEEEVESPKKQQQLPARTPESKKQQKQQGGSTPESNKQKKRKQQAEQGQQQSKKQQQNKPGQQQQQNKQGQQQQQNKQGQQQQQNQKSPQKTPQHNKTPQKTPQPNKNQQKTPQQGKQGKTPQQVNGSPEKKPQKKVVKGVIIEDVAEGNGKVASANKKIGVQYVGRLARNKKEFDKSHEPFRFVLGRGEVIPGWDIGVDGMRVGGKRRLTIPANLAYGSKGAPPAIPPNSNLEFEVTLVSVK